MAIALLKNRIRNLNDAFLYQADCQLATCVSLAMRKTRSKYDYERHISIAQNFCDFIRDFHVEIPEGTSCRVSSVFECDNSVKKYLERYDVRLRSK